MSLNPLITRDSMGVFWLKWTPDPQASGYAFTTPTGAGRTFNPAQSKAKLGDKLTEPFTVQVRPLFVTSGPVELASYPPVVDPPPAGRPAFPKGGIGFWEPGSNVPAGSDRYDMGILANWQYDAGQKNGAGLKLLYTAARCPDSTDYFYGMTATELRAWGWATTVYSSTSPHGLIPYLTNPGFATKWAQNVAGYLDLHNLDGVEIDDIDGKRGELYSGSIPVYPSDAAWQDANVQFIQTAAGYLRDRGFYVLANTSGDAAFKLRVAALVDAVMLEDFTTTQTGMAGKILAAGCDAVALAYTNPVQVRAAMESLGDGRAVTMYHTGGDPAGPWMGA